MLPTVLRRGLRLKKKEKGFSWRVETDSHSYREGRYDRSAWRDEAARLFRDHPSLRLVYLKSSASDSATTVMRDATLLSCAFGHDLRGETRMRACCYDEIIFARSVSKAVDRSANVQGLRSIYHTGALVSHPMVRILRGPVASKMSYRRLMNYAGGYKTDQEQKAWLYALEELTISGHERRSRFKSTPRIILSAGNSSSLSVDISTKRLREMYDYCNAVWLSPKPTLVRYNGLYHDYKARKYE
jgi:hypothetical protein